MRSLTSPRSRSYHSVAVSGECSSGKSTLCKTLSKSLNWQHIDVGNDFRKIANMKGLKIEEFGCIPDTLLRQLDDTIQHRIQTEVNKIWDGRLTCYFARTRMKILKVYCVADLNIRVKRCASRDKIHFVEAHRRIIARDIEEASVFKRLYGISDAYNKKWVNLLLNTSSSTPEKSAKTVLQALFPD